MYRIREFARLKISLLFVAGVINTEGAMWKDQRRFLHDKLRSFGMTYMGAGKKIMESRIMVSSRSIKILFLLFFVSLVLFLFLFFFASFIVISIKQRVE